MARVYGNHHLDWKGNRLGLINGRRLVEIVVDPKHPTMWRVRQLPNGDKSDMVNIVRARDYARRLALSMLNAQQETAAEAPPVRYSELTLVR